MTVIPEHEKLCYHNGYHEYVLCGYTFEGAIIAIFFACQWCGRQEGY